MPKKIVVGIDIGGTNTVFGFVDENGDVLIEKSIPTQTHEKIEDFVGELAGLIKQGEQELKNDYKLAGIGIGAPNANFYTGTIDNAPNLRWKGKINMVALFKQHFKLPIIITNDANAAALGEMVFGGAKNMKNFVFITLGTGLGSGIVINGNLVYGHDGFAGEMGHIVVKRDGRSCNCGLKGCVETYVSATGIVRSTALMLSNKTDASPLREIPYNELTSKKVYEAAVQKDPIALETFNYTAQHLGQALANATVMLSPEAFFVFGGLAQAGSLFLDKVKAYMEEKMMPLFQNKVQVIPSQLKSNAAILGAAALIYSEQ